MGQRVSYRGTHNREKPCFSDKFSNPPVIPTLVCDRTDPMLSLSRGFYFVVAAFLLAALPCPGQTGLGSITGEVVDASGAKLPHATLRLVESSTQTTFGTVA